MSLIEKLSQEAPYTEAEFLTFYMGEDAKDEELEKMKEIFQKHCPDAEITVQPSQQPVYDYIISAE